MEGELGEALAKICRSEVELTVAGRTDAGVHARGQVAHFEIPSAVLEKLTGRGNLSPEQALIRKLNAVLTHTAPGPKGYSDIVVHNAEIVSADFDARFSALWRLYTYRIADGPSNWDPMRADVLWVPTVLDLTAMNEAAQPLLGEHDFLSFCKPRPGASTVRTLQEFSFSRERDGEDNQDAENEDVKNNDAGLISVRVRADAFCHSQVRTLVGTLIEVGRGAKNISWPAARLAARVRDGEVIVAPAHGLTLEEIGYPVASEYGRQAKLARRFRGSIGEECDCDGF